MRDRKREHRGPAGSVRMAASESEGSGKLVSVAENVWKSYGDDTIVRDFGTRIIRGDRVGIVGPNGAGKTTLLRLLTGKLQPDRGEVRIGTNLAEVSLDQSRASLDPQATLSQTLTGGAGDQVMVNDQKRHVIGYMKDFLFRPEQARTAVGVLSGGERGRLMLAKALAQQSNLMVLDEPTNDLDLETLDLLQEMLADYQGTVLLVSHDRDFLDRVVTSTIASEGDGRWTEYAGGYSDMLAQRGAGAAPPVAARPQQSAPGQKQKPALKPAVKKLSFKDRHALEQLPAEMQKLQVQIRRHQQTLSDGTLYKKDPARFAAESSALSRAEQALVTAEERWLELELLREQSGG